MFSLHSNACPAGQKATHEVRMTKAKHKAKGRGGRPSIPSDQVRRHTIGVRVNEDERNRIQEKADRMNMAPAQWLRHAALDRILPPCPAPKLNRDMYVELGKIGTNINQLVKASNSGRMPHPLPPLRNLVNIIINLRLEILGVSSDSQTD